MAKTVCDAVYTWVETFNTFPIEMIEQLMEMDDGTWQELTALKAGDDVYVYDLPENCDSTEHSGRILDMERKKGVCKVRLADGGVITTERDNLEAEYDSMLPMWRKLWQFKNDLDNQWLSEKGGIELMSGIGFRIYRHKSWGYFFGIDAAGSDFYTNFFTPLYIARGLKLHDPVAEYEHQMRSKGYQKRKFGNMEFWFDAQGNVVRRVG